MKNHGDTDPIVSHTENDMELTQNKDESVYTSKRYVREYRGAKRGLPFCHERKGIATCCANSVKQTFPLIVVAEITPHIIIRCFKLLSAAYMD